MWAIMIIMRKNAPRMPKLGERLTAAAEMLGEAPLVWDVGCDHGFLAAALIEQGRAERVLATDLSPVSVQKTARLAERRGLDGITAMQADGLSGFIPEGRYKLALCGMGGELIAEILEAGHDKAMHAELIVMQPMRGEEELRKYLHEHGFRITEERVVCDAGRYYQLISAAYGRPEDIPDWFPKGYYRFGWVMCERPGRELIALLKKYRAVYQARLDGARDRENEPSKLIFELDSVDAIISHIKEKGLWQ